MALTMAGQRAALTRAAARPWLPPVTVAAGAAAVVGAVGVIDPSQPGHYPGCPFLALTGLYCPGCGSLRAIHAMAHGDLSTALARNPLTVVLTVGLVVLWVRWVSRRYTGRPAGRTAPGWVVWAAAAAVTAFWVLRNLPGFAFLAP